jgi:hypothetical protein
MVSKPLPGTWLKAVIDAEVYSKICSMFRGDQLRAGPARLAAYVTANLVSDLAANVVKTGRMLGPKPAAMLTAHWR